MNMVESIQKFYHTEIQAQAIVDSYSDDEWIAVVRPLTSGKFAVDLFERDGMIVIAKNI